MKTTKEIRKILGLILILTNSVYGFGQSIENSYVVNQQVTIGGSSLFYVQISGIPSGATITNVEAKFEYIAYGVVQNYVSSRFNKDSDPGSTGGVVLVSQGNLPSGNPGTYGYSSFSNWNGQTGINSNYYFRFNLGSSSPYTCTINKIYVRVTYTTPTLTVTAPNGGETWYKGTNYTITWNSSDVTGNVQIDLYKGGSNVLQLAAGASNTGSYTFNPPTSLTNGSDYKVGISAMSGSVSDFSNNYFTILYSQTLAPPFLISPTNGGTLAGTPYIFSWQSINDAGAYQIKIADNASFTNPIVNDQNISGSATSFQANASLTYGQTYYWQMRTLNSLGTAWSSWGQYQIFIVSNLTSNQPTDDYPVSYKNSNKVCEDNMGVPDIWGFYRRECTSFVCWRINRDKGFTQLKSTDPFTNYTVLSQKTHLGNANNWTDALEKLNFKVDTIPQVGDIAYWSIYKYGHVAYVQSVNSDNSVNIEEYNFSDNCATMGLYSYRKNIKAEKYIHIRDGYGGITNINNQSLSSSFMIYPNPANSFVTIAFVNSDYLQNCKIIILNSTGSIVSIIPINEMTLKINIENLSSGLYLMLIEIGGKTETYKLIKE